MKKIAFLLLFLFLIAACGKAGAPDCDNNDVQKKVISLITSDLRSMFIKGSYNPPFFPYKTYEELEKGVKENQRHFKDKDAIDQVTSSLKLSNIRPTFKDDGLKKCKCSADLSMEGKSKKVTIEYTAQFTSDGLLVEVAPVSWERLFGPPSAGPSAGAAPEAQN